MSTEDEQYRDEADAPVDQDGLGSVRVIDRVMRILKALSRQQDDVTLTELSKNVGLHKSTVLRFLKALETGEFVAPGQGGRGWRLGSAALEMRMRSLDQRDLCEAARPILQTVARRIGETVQIAVLSGESVVYIEKIEPPELVIRINTQIGVRRPVHCTALGKLLCAHSDRAEVERIIGTAGLKRFTERTIVSASALFEELARIRARGYAIDEQEFNDVVTCVAAPIRDSNGDVIAGVSISTIAMRVESARFQELVVIVQELADDVSRAIGWSGKHPHVSRNATAQ